MKKILAFVIALFVFSGFSFVEAKPTVIKKDIESVVNDFGVDKDQKNNYMELEFAFSVNKYVLATFYYK